MSTLTHSLCVVGAGVLAFGAVFGAHQLTTPLLASDAHANGSEEHMSGDAPDAGSDTVIPEEGALVGRWQAPEPANQDAFVEFTEYGLWYASDGCNRMSGTWRLGIDGALEVGGSRAMTMIGCDNVAIPTAVSTAVSAAFTDDGRLVLSDSEGTGFELVRAREDGVSLAGRWVADMPGSLQTSYLELSDDGRWTGSDGCNTTSGSWRVGDAADAGDAPAGSDDGEFIGIGDDVVIMPGEGDSGSADAGSGSADAGSGSADAGSAGGAPDIATDFANGFVPLDVGELSPMTRMMCEDMDTVSLPLDFADATAFAVTDENSMTLAVHRADELVFVLLQRST